MTARTQPQAHLQTHIQPDHAPIEGEILLPAEPLEPATAKRRERANATAIALARGLQLEGRQLTPEERAVLLTFSGAGGTETITDPTSETGDGNTLGVLNEYYTPTGLARAVWTILERLGFRGGLALEPSAGTGVFLETAPASVKFTAVELNPDAALINALLHPRATVRVMPFERDQQHTGELEYDLVIGNPPFGPRGLNALQDKPNRKSYAPYFLEAGLDRLRDGGLLAMVVPSGLIDSGKPLGFRERLLARARLRALVRLPVSSFQGSGARAATDLIVLEKRPWVVGDTLASLLERHEVEDLLGAGIFDAAAHDFLRGEFFVSKPDHLLGELVSDPRWGGTVCDGILDAAALERLANTPLLESPLGPTSLGGLLKRFEISPNFIALAQTVKQSVRTLLETGWRDARTAGYPNVEGSKRADGCVFKYGKTDGRWTRGWRAPSAEHASLSSALKVGESIAVFNTARVADAHAPTTESARAVALRSLQRHLDLDGNPHVGLLVKTASRMHPVLYGLLGAVRSDGAVAPVLLNPVVTTVERSTDLGRVCRDLDALKRLTPETLLEHWQGGSREAVHAALYESDDWLLTPDGRFTASTNLAHGDVLERAAFARAQATSGVDFHSQVKLVRQAEWLESLRPQRSLEEFDLTGTEGWIPVSILQAWFEESYPHLEFQRDSQTGRVSVSVEEEAAKKARISKAQIEEDRKTLARFFNLEHTAKPVGDATRLSSEAYAAARKARIEEAQERERALGLKFRHFVAANLEHRELIESEYNRLFNAFVTGQDDPSPLAQPGWFGPVPHGYQNHGVRFSRGRANALIAFDTGLGKTLTASAIGEDLLESGRAKRVLVVVPKGLLVNWQRTLSGALPFRRLVTVGLTQRDDGNLIEDDQPAVLEKLHAFALGAFEVMLISREWFRRIRLSAEHLRKFIAEEAFLLNCDEASDPYGLGNDDDRDDNARQSQRTSREKTLTLAERQSALAARLWQEHALPHLTFEDLGADALIVDEAGGLKNLYAAPTFFGKKPKFMGASLESDRALDTYFKVKALHAANGSRNVIYLTATPTKNSPLELFNILKPLAGETFDRLGIFGPAQFIERYCQIETVLYPNATGLLEAVPGVVGFKNLTELRGLMGQFILHRTAEDVGLRIPELETVEHVFELSDKQKSMYRQLRLEAQIALNDPNGEHGIHLFSVYAQMRLLTLEPSLVSKSFDRNPRFEVAAKIALESTKQGGKIVCFMDVGNASEEVAGTRKKRAGPDAYDLLKAAMVHAGIPAEWIAIVTGDRVKGSKRQAIADEYNAGKVRIIIGSTGTIGEGFDLQVGTTDLIHLDIPWDPGTFHQRVGRGHRQGNFSNLLRNHILLARGSFDGLTYAMMRGKRGWQQQLWHSGEDRSRNSAVLSYDEILAALSDDPDKARLEIEQQRANIEAQKLEQRRQMGLARFRLYLETLDHQTLAWQRAMGRKNGPTANDHKLKGNFERQLERYRQSLMEDSSFAHTDLLDGRICLLTSSGMILAAGVKFSITEAEKLLEYRVESLGFRHNDDGKWVKAVGLEPDGGDGNLRVFQEADLERLKVTVFTPGSLSVARVRLAIHSSSRARLIVRP